MAENNEDPQLSLRCMRHLFPDKHRQGAFSSSLNIEELDDPSVSGKNMTFDETRSSKDE